MQSVTSSTRPCPACSHQDHPAETIIPFLPLFHSLFPCISGLRYVGKLRSLCIKNSAIRVSSEKPRNRLSAVKISFLSRHTCSRTRGALVWRHAQKVNAPRRNVCCQADWGKGASRRRQAACCEGGEDVHHEASYADATSVAARR